MLKFKKTMIIGAMVLTIGATSLTAFAASKYNTPAQAAAGLTGKTVESVISEKAETGKTYGTIAKEAGKLTEFKNETLEIKKDALDDKVKNGTLTQERADEIMAALKENQKNCDGTGSDRIGQKMGAGFGGNGGKNGGGMGKGQGKGEGQGLGFSGTCQAE